MEEEGEIEHREKLSFADQNEGLEPEQLKGIEEIDNWMIRNRDRYCRKRDQRRNCRCKNRGCPKDGEPRVKSDRVFPGKAKETGSAAGDIKRRFEGEKTGAKVREKHDVPSERSRPQRGKNAAEIAAVIRQEEGAPEMVSAVLDEIGDTDQEILGDFFFQPLLGEEDTTQYFSVVITITDMIPEERLSELYEAISYVNFSLPAGNFCIDKDHRFFCYVLSVPLPMEMEDTALFTEMDLAAGNAFAIADAHIGILTDVLNGKENADGVVAFLGGRTE